MNSEEIICEVEHMSRYKDKIAVLQEYFVAR